MKFNEFRNQCQASPDCPCDPAHARCSVNHCPIIKVWCVEAKSRFDVTICVACDSYFQDPDNIVLCDEVKEQ